MNGIENWSGLRDAFAVTGNSQTGYNIVGSGFSNGSALRQAFLVKGLVIPVPEPDCFTMVVVAALITFLVKYYCAVKC
ncbi:hypothetical protein GC170_18520 [bacterium]|nr:hypothetical protein [bacterium]